MKLLVAENSDETPAPRPDLGSSHDDASAAVHLSARLEARRHWASPRRDRDDDLPHHPPFLRDLHCKFIVAVGQVPGAQRP